MRISTNGSVAVIVYYPNYKQKPRHKDGAVVELDQSQYILSRHLSLIISFFPGTALITHTLFSDEYHCFHPEMGVP